MQFAFEHTYAKLPSRFYARVKPASVTRPSLLALNTPLAETLGLDPKQLSSPEGVAALAGNRLPDDADPIALAYAGHQFGHFVPQLGDGRAILLGEIVGRDGRRRDVQLKGAGRTPYSRGGDGKAALGPVLREFLVSEAMAALGVPTTRSLAAVATGDAVLREERLPGAVLTRVAASHLRVGTFQFFSAREDREAIEQLTHYALTRHYPDVSTKDGEAIALLDSVIKAQASLVAQWLSFGFVHGVMNTDNTSIAGETIDYGPCAFLDTYDPKRFFSSIDSYGRYAFANQPRIALWNLARLADTLLPLISDDEKQAVAVLSERLKAFPEHFEQAHDDAFRRKLGLYTQQPEDGALAEELLQLMAAEQLDFTLFFRRLSEALTHERPSLETLFKDATAFRAWCSRWKQRIAEEKRPTEEHVALMLRANPKYIPRNHRVEEMIDAALDGNLAPFERLHRVLAHPFDEQPNEEELATPPGNEQWSYQTFCGT